MAIEAPTRRSLFIFSKTVRDFSIEKLHTCLWELTRDRGLLEIGFEINKDQLYAYKGTDFTLFIDFPFQNPTARNPITNDLYKALVDIDNVQFIFNETVDRISPVEKGTKDDGQEIVFMNGEGITLLPCNRQINDGGYLSVTFHVPAEINYNVYVRFNIECRHRDYSSRDNAISSSTITFDFRVNESRSLHGKLRTIRPFLCSVRKCFHLTIVPNDYQIAYLNPTLLKEVRLLEEEKYKNYFGNNKLPKRKFIVIFQKTDVNAPKFFYILKREVTGVPQLATAVGVNIICGFTFFLSPKESYFEYWLYGMLVLLFVCFVYLHQKARIAL